MKVLEVISLSKQAPAAPHTTAVACCLQLHPALTVVAGLVARLFQRARLRLTLRARSVWHPAMALLVVVPYPRLSAPAARALVGTSPWRPALLV